MLGLRLILLNPRLRIRDIHNWVMLSELCVCLSVLSVKPVLTTIQLVFNAEFAEADAETAEKKLIIKCFFV